MAGLQTGLLGSPGTPISRSAPLVFPWHLGAPGTVCVPGSWVRPLLSCHPERAFCAKDLNPASCLPPIRAPSRFYPCTLALLHFFTLTLPLFSRSSQLPTDNRKLPLPGAPHAGFACGSWVCLFLLCHPDRSGPIFSSAPNCGASGRAAEGSWHPHLTCPHWPISSGLSTLAPSLPPNRAPSRFDPYTLALFHFLASAAPLNHKLTTANPLC